MLCLAMDASISVAVYVPLAVYITIRSGLHPVKICRVVPCLYNQCHWQSCYRPRNNSFAIVFGFESMTLCSPWRWYICSETWWRSWPNVCIN